MKYKKIGDILFLNENLGNLDELSGKHMVKTIMRINHIWGTKRESSYEVQMAAKQKLSIRRTNASSSLIFQKWCGQRNYASVWSTLL